VQIDAHLNIVAFTAKSWDISEDKKTYRFHLRRDVFFHDDDVFRQEGQKTGCFGYRI